MAKAPLLKSARVEKALGKEALQAVEAEVQKAIKAANAERKGFLQPFILVEYNKEKKQAQLCASLKPLLQTDIAGVQHYVVHLDPTSGYPASIVKNLLGAVALGMSEKKKTIAFISLRDKVPKECTRVEFKDSLYYETTVEKTEKLEWDTWLMKDKTTMQEWNIDLKQVMDRKVYLMLVELVDSPKTRSI